MVKDLIHERDSAYQPREPLALEEPLKFKESSPFAVMDRYSSSLASCNEIPLPIYAAQSLFIESEKEIVSTIGQEKQKKEKESFLLFLKRLTLKNIKIQMVAFFARTKEGVIRFFAKAKDTLASWKDHVGDFFKGNKVNKKAEDLVSTEEVNASAKGVVNEPSKAVSASAVAPLPLNADGLENRRIKEIEETFTTYEGELRKSNGNLRKMMELLGQISILTNSLGYRYSKKEIKDYMDHLEVNVKQRVKTFEGGHTWSYCAIVLYGTAAVSSFGGVAGGFMGASAVGKVLTGLGQTSSSVSYLGQGVSKLSDITSEEKTARRTEYEHIGEKYKQIRTDMERTTEKTNQSIQQLLDLGRQRDQAEFQAKRSAAGAA